MLSKNISTCLLLIFLASISLEIVLYPRYLNVSLFMPSSSVIVNFPFKSVAVPVLFVVIILTPIS